MSNGAKDDLDALIDEVLGSITPNGWLALFGGGGVLFIGWWVYTHFHRWLPTIERALTTAGHMALVLGALAGALLVVAGIAQEVCTQRTLRSRVRLLVLGPPNWAPTEAQIAGFMLQVHGFRRRTWRRWLDHAASAFRVLMLRGEDGRALYLWEVPRRHLRSIHRAAESSFGQGVVRLEEAPSLHRPTTGRRYRLELQPARRDEWSFRRIPTGLDPKSSFAHALTSDGRCDWRVISWALQPMPPQRHKGWLKKMLDHGEKKGNDRPKSRLDAAERYEEKRQERAIWKKVDDHGNQSALFYTQTLLEVQGPDDEESRLVLEDMRGGFEHWQSANFMAAVGHRTGGSDAFWRANGFDRRMGGLFSSDRVMAAWELAMAAIPWTAAGTCEDVVRLEPEVAQPPDVALNGSGRIMAVYKGEPVRQSPEQARAHTHVVGPTDSGKTTQLVNMALGDIADGRAVVPFVDPKEGVGVDNLAARIERKYWDRVVWIDPSRTDASIGLNLLENRDPDRTDIVVGQVIALFASLYHDVWGQRQEEVMQNCLFTLLRHEGTTLCDIPILLTDQEARRRWTRDLEDSDLRAFWNWYDNLSPVAQGDHVGTLLSRLRQLLLWPRVRNILGQRKSTIDLGHLLDNGGIVLARLPEEYGKTSELIGSVLFLATWQAVQKRQSVPEDKRPDAVAYWDEFYLFLRQLGRSFPDVFARARSYRWGQTIAHQYMDQLATKELKAAAASSTRTKNYYRCGDDARILAPAVRPITQGMLERLDKYQVAIALGYDPAFVASTRPYGPALRDPSELASYSLKRYGKTREEIERERAMPAQPRASGRRHTPFDWGS